MSAIKSCDSLLNLFSFSVCLKSWMNDSSCLWFSNFSINLLTLFSRVVFCCSSPKTDATTSFVMRLCPPPNPSVFRRLPVERVGKEGAKRQTSLSEVRCKVATTSTKIAQTEEKNKKLFEKNQSGPLQPHVKTHRGMMVNPKNEFWSQEISFTVITWNPESNCTCRLRNHTQFLLKNFDVTRLPTRR